ncbi:MAG: hypothetical protein OXL37_12265 [Chloroflexota bacterium]|nr:hypothetical protein [Chloroflexota bacterium]MDE2960856.1 hypothetical protein [Chloroflexota bacterium]
MVASTVNRRSRYREYAQFLRLSADRLDMAVAPGRLEHLRSKVNAERNTFLAWVIIWSILALICIAPLVMLLVARLDLPAPAYIAAQSDALFSRLWIGEAPTNADFVANGSLLTFLAAIVIGYAPIIAYGGPLNDIEHAHQTLKAIERG